MRPPRIAAAAWRHGHSRIHLGVPGGSSMRVRGFALAILLVALGADAGRATRATADAGVAVAVAAGVHRFASAEQPISFEGRGAGHGVGLCQWGARGRALAGQSAEEIVGAYYTGTSVQHAAPPETVVRVRIHEGLQPAAETPSRIVGWGGAWQAVIEGVAVPVVAPAGAHLTLGRDAGGVRYAVVGEDGSVLADGPLVTPLVLRPLEAGVRFGVGYKPAREVAGRPGTRYDAYRGELVLTARENGLETINRVGLDDYLRGVVPVEMPASWPGEALRAQALVSRSYAVWRGEARAAERYDLTDTAADQAYLGAHAEHPVTDGAVGSTAGQLVTYEGRVAQTVFFSTCGGWTDNNESVWPSGTPVPYLRGIRDADADGRAYDAGAPQSAWKTGAVTAAQLDAMLAGSGAGGTGTTGTAGTAGAGAPSGATAGATAGAGVGRLVGLDLSQRTASGRLLQVTLVGTLGTKTMRPDEFIARFNAARPTGVPPLNSTVFGVVTVETVETAGRSGAPPSAPTSQAAAARSRVHTVQSGETLYGIARSRGTTVGALVAANGLGSADAILRVGQRLLIP